MHKISIFNFENACLCEQTLWEKKCCCECYLNLTFLGVPGWPASPSKYENRQDLWRSQTVRERVLLSDVNATQAHVRAAGRHEQLKSLFSDQHRKCLISRHFVEFLGKWVKQLHSVSAFVVARRRGAIIFLQLFELFEQSSCCNFITNTPKDDWSWTESFSSDPRTSTDYQPIPVTWSSPGSWRIPTWWHITGFFREFWTVFIQLLERTKPISRTKGTLA